MGEVCPVLTKAPSLMMMAGPPVISPAAWVTEQKVSLRRTVNTQAQKNVGR